MHNDHRSKAAILWRSSNERLGTSKLTTSLLDSVLHRLEVLQDLEVPFTKKEIDDVVNILPTDKATGLDGFNGVFIKVGI